VQKELYSLSEERRRFSYLCERVWTHGDWFSLLVHKSKGFHLNGEDAVFHIYVKECGLTVIGLVC